MNMRLSTCSIVRLIILMLLSLSVYGQPKQKPVVDQKPEIPTLSIFFDGLYYGPKFADVNAIYKTIEQNYSLPRGGDFNNVYNVITGVRFVPMTGQAMQGEFGFSVFKSTRDSSTNYLQLYSLGGSYIVSISLPLVSVYGGGGLSYLWLNTQRTYTTSNGVARVNAQLAQLHGLLGVEFFSHSGVSFALEGRYNYATTITPKRADLNFTLKGITGGVRIGIPLL
jgi:hypothetical protein